MCTDRCLRASQPLGQMRLAGPDTHPPPAYLTCDDTRGDPATAGHPAAEDRVGHPQRPHAVYVRSSVNGRDEQAHQHPPLGLGRCVRRGTCSTSMSPRTAWTCRPPCSGSTSLLPWGRVPDHTHVAKYDYRDIELVAGEDPTPTREPSTSPGRAYVRTSRAAAAADTHAEPSSTPGEDARMKHLRQLAREVDAQVTPPSTRTGRWCCPCAYATAPPARPA